MSITRDISGWKKTQMELEQSERRLNILVNNLQGIAYKCLFDNHWTMEFISSGFEKITGYKCDDIIGNKKIEFNDIIIPEDRQRVFSEVTGSLAVSNQYEVKFKIKTTKDEILHVNDKGVAIYNELGDIQALEGFITDITKQVEAIEALRESEQKLRLIINNSPFGITSNDLDGHLIDVNPAVCKIIGFSREEMLGKHFNFYTHPGDRDKNVIKFSELIEGKIPFFELEKRYIHKNGNTVHALIRSQLIHDHLGKPIFQTAIIEDITKRKRTEQIQKILFNISNAAVSTGNLEKLIGIIRQELAIIINTTNFYVALYDEETGNISLPFFADEKDYHSYIPKGKSLTKYVIDTKKSLLVNIEQKNKLIEEGKLEHIGSISKIWLGVPLKIEGKVTGVLALQSYTDENAYNELDVKMLEFVSDQISVTIQRKKAETELKTALAKANESDRLKSSFLATISHELRTPLNAIIGFSEFLDRQLPPDDIEKFGQIIHTSGLHLLSIVNDMFDITIIETGKTKIVKEVINPASILDDVSNVIFSNTNEISKKIEIKLNAPEGSQNHWVYTDTNKLKQILINLLKNASKFTSEGFIHYGYSFITENDKPYIRFYVKDSGIGISEDKQDLIFNIFRQVDESNARKYGGAGIGLSVAKRLTEILGGRIWLISKPCEGSCFYFTIPLENREDNGKNL